MKLEPIKHPVTGCTCAEGHLIWASKPDSEFPTAKLPTGGWAIFLPPVHDCAYIEKRNAKLLKKPSALQQSRARLKAARLKATARA